MKEIEIVVVLLAMVALLTVVARRIGIPYPIVMVIGGLAIGFLPGIPPIALDPDIVLLLFLPPILFSAAYLSSPRDLWRNVRPISLLALGLVLTTILAVAGVLTVLAPAIPLVAAVAMGAIVSPTDAIAATATAQRFGLPRRIVTILEGESLVNDATALVTYRLAVAAATTTVAFSFGEAAVEFAVVALGGVVIGLAVGWGVSWILARLEDPPVEVLVTLIAPFAAYLPAELLHVSGVLAAVSGGLLLGWRAPRVMSSDTRVLGFASWQMTVFVVNGVAFLLIGLQLPQVMDAIVGRSPGELVGLGLAVALTVIVVRLLWVFPATYIPRWVVPGLAARDPAPPAAAVVVLGWAGMRGAVSLAAALALPIGFPERDLLIFLTFVTILATLVGQGLSLPFLIRLVGLGDDGSAEHEERHAREAATAAALSRLDELVTEIPGHQPMIDQLRDRYSHRAEHYARDHHDGDGDAPDDPEERDHEAIRRAVLAAERVAIIELRDRAVISDEVLRRVERDLDLDELRRDI